LFFVDRRKEEDKWYVQLIRYSEFLFHPKKRNMYNKTTINIID
jgi:hypothetical protein